ILGGSGGPALAEDPAPATSAAPPATRPAYTPPERDGPAGGGLGTEGAALLGGGGVLAALLAYLGLRPRKCRDCGQKMEKLGEQADDVHLDSGQKLEETLGSVNYAVWRCGACNKHEIVPRRALFTSTRECPACRYRTLQVKTQVLEHPTYTSTGRQRITKDCRQCGHHDEDFATLPMKTRPSTTSSSSGSRSSFGGSSSSSSGSSSRSSGRGAGGKW
ncbi:MAG TPA: hypothetical protein VFX98_11550, partial [Longimicrobiaceae bacterium]|nr:hypothetical protein [Longimicrobiaceae bacterium]